MNLGGGLVLLEGNEQWYGVGYNAVASFEGQDYLVYHAYDAKDKGRSKFQIKKISWNNGWPIIDDKPGL